MSLAHVTCGLRGGSQTLATRAVAGSTVAAADGALAAAGRREGKREGVDGLVDGWPFFSHLFLGLSKFTLKP